MEFPIWFIPEIFLFPIITLAIGGKIASFIDEENIIVWSLIFLTTSLVFTILLDYAYLMVLYSSVARTAGLIVENRHYFEPALYTGSVIVCAFFGFSLIIGKITATNY